MSAQKSCPACYQVVKSTGRRQVIAPHWDTAGNKCVGERLPYRCAIVLPPKSRRFAA